jgi:hypothetical protein
MGKSLEHIYEILGLDGKQENPYVCKDMSRAGMYAKIFAGLGFKIGAEIGVFQGRNARGLWKFIPDLMLYLVDPWIDYDGQRKYRGPEKLESGLKGTKKIARNRKHKFLRMKSVEASLQVPDHSLDFVYIDGNHRYDYVMLDIILWTEKLKPGGIISGHDYTYKEKSLLQVKPAILDYTRRNKVRPWFLTDYHAEHRRKGGQASWFWVVE